MKDRTVRALRDELLDAARVYARESDGGANPLEAGAKLRIAAKVWARADREVSTALAPRASRASSGLPVVRTSDVE